MASADVFKDLHAKEITSTNVKLTHSGATSFGTQNLITLIPNKSTGSGIASGALSILNTDNIGRAIDIYSDKGSGATAELMRIISDNVLFDRDALSVRQDGNEDAIFIDYRGAGGAALRVDSTSGPILFPRMTSVQMQAMTSPISGSTVYNTTSGSMYCFTTIWNAMF